MQTNEQLACEADSSRMFEEFFESSRVLREELAYLRNAATSNLTILITGESGTGKELVACAVHRLSHRSPRAFVRINCAAIQPQLIASEPFGQRKGRRSPQAQPRLDCLPLAEGGTIFLEGVDDLAAEAQLGLLTSSAGPGVCVHRPKPLPAADCHYTSRFAGCHRRGNLSPRPVFPAQ